MTAPRYRVEACMRRWDWNANSDFQQGILQDDSVAPPQKGWLLIYWQKINNMTTQNTADNPHVKSNNPPTVSGGGFGLKPWCALF